MKDLLEKYIRNECTPEEVHQLLALFSNIENEAELRQAIYKYLHATDSTMLNEGLPVQKTVQSVYQKLEQTIQQSSAPVQGRVVFIRRKFFVRTVAAAVMVLLIGASVYLVSKSPDKKPTAQNAEKPVVTDDVAPGGNRAVLTLADGSTVVLDSAGNGAIAQQGSVTVIKLDDGQLAYQSSDAPARTASYNTITTPKGGQYQLALADGTKIWLNAASSLRFPAAFTGKERRVELTGEGYFEVAHNAAKPFFVTINSPLKSDVQVLGTHFNVNAYNDDGTARSTLLEGSVRLNQNGRSQLLQPGQQGIVGTDKASIVVKEVDVEKMVAWKKNLFQFDGDNIGQVMLQLTRWYDVEVQFAGRKPEGHFSGLISRDMPLSKVLYLLESYGVDFKTTGKKVTVTSK